MTNTGAGVGVGQRASWWAETQHPIRCDVQEAAGAGLGWGTAMGVISS